MRCESVYSDCNGVTYGEAIGSPDPRLSAEKLPFVTRVCPQGYGRYGCCKCNRKCDLYPNLFDLTVTDNNEFCEKKNAITSEMSDIDADGFEPITDKFVKKCPVNWTRVGMRLCVPRCPHGWPDHVNRHMKVAGINLMAFVWQPGDEN